MEKLKVSDVSGADFLRRFLEERGIDPDGAVARERGYAPYDKGDADAVYAALERTHPGYMENEAGRLNERWVDRFSRDTVGFVIPKFRVFPHLARIRPQLRPENPPVFEWHHNHGDRAVSADGEPMTAEELAAHRTGKNRRAEHEAQGIGPRSTRRMHVHRDENKYAIAPLIRTWALEKRGVNLEAVGISPGYDDSKRLDMNPISVPDLTQPGPVFFGIEGTPKNDAMVEWLRANGRPAKVVNVPSVSTWRAPELALFALRHMRGHLAVVVPDADWFDNDEVIYHAENAAIYLRHRCGVNVVIAAPPQHAGHKGVDDFLGDDGSLDDLDVIQRDFDPVALADWEDTFRSLHRSQGGNRATLERRLELARLLGRTSGRQGRTLRNTSALARLMPAGVMTEAEALSLSVPPEFYERDGNAERRERATYDDLEHLAGVAFQHTGEFPEWVETRWETVGRKKDGTPRRVRKKGSMGSRIEWLSVDQRLRMRQAEPQRLGDLLGQ